MDMDSMDWTQTVPYCAGVCVGGGGGGVGRAFLVTPGAFAAAICVLKPETQRVGCYYYTT